MDAPASPACDDDGARHAGITAGADIAFDFAGVPAADWRWTHLRHCPATVDALYADPALPVELVRALVEQDTLPRAVVAEGQLLLMLRGINHAAGADPADMVSVRMIVDEARMVSLEMRPNRQIDAMVALFESGTPPPGPGKFLCRLIGMLRAEIEIMLDEIEKEICDLEQVTLDRTSAGLDHDAQLTLADTRRRLVLLHRYMAPQANALEEMVRQDAVVLAGRKRLRSEASAFRRIAADIEALRTRTQLLAEEADRALFERTNRIMLTLSAVSVVFLPLTFLTGLLGVNLGGIPGAASATAFAVFTALLSVMGGLAVWLAIRLLR